MSPKGQSTAEITKNANLASVMRSRINSEAADAVGVDLPQRIPPFPLEALPEPLRNYCIESAATPGVPADYVAGPILGAVASAIGSNWEISLGGEWRERACLYIATVGPPSSGRSPALRLAMKPIYELQEVLNRRFKIERERHLKSLHYPYL